MNDKGKQKASRKPTTALAKTKARKGALHPVRRETTTNQESLCGVCSRAEGLYAGEDRCESSLQGCSILSGVNLPPLMKAVLRRVNYWQSQLWSESILTSPEAFQIAWRALSAWQEFLLRLSNRPGFPSVSIVHDAILIEYEADEKHSRGRPSVPSTTRTTTGSGEKSPFTLRPAGNGGGVASTSVQTLCSPRRSYRSPARKIQIKNKNNK